MYSYKGWLISDRFLKRAFAILGYSTVATLIIYGGLLLIILIIAVMVGGIGAMIAAMYT